MIRNVLAHAASFGHWPQNLRYAIEIAARFDAALTGLYVCESPVPVVLPDATAVASALEAYVRDHKDAARARAGEFERWAKERGVAHAQWQVAEGHVPDVLGFAGNWHDLLVLGRSGEGAWQGVGAIGQIIVDAALPCIVVPPGEAPRSLALDRIVIGWNGSTEAIRAVHAALPLLREAGTVIALDGSDRRPTARLAEAPQFDLSAHLARNGVAVEIERIDAEDAEAGRALIDACDARRADLLVMGAYGRTRFSEWILGGATRELLGHARFPVFLRH